MNNYFAIIQSDLLGIISRNNFLNKIEDNKEYVICSEDNGIFLFLICDEIELRFKISNFNIYKSRSDTNIKQILVEPNIQEAVSKLQTKHLRLKMEYKSFLFLLKVSNISKLIILKINEGSHLVSLVYDNKETILNVDTDQVLNLINYDINFYNRKDIIITKILSDDFSDIITSHQSISDNKIINDDNQNIQIQIIENKIKFLSTNYIVGLINQIKSNINTNENIQLQISKNIEILKIHNLFQNSKYVYIINGDNKHDISGRIRSKFIKFTDESNFCYVRLYDSKINTFDETIIDDQIKIDSKYVINKIVIIKIVETIKASFDIKKLDIIDILIINNDIKVVCKSYDYSFNFNLKINEITDSKNNKLKIKISGSTANTIYQILIKNKKACNINIYTSDSSEQGRINYDSEYTTDIIFV